MEKRNKFGYSQLITCIVFIIKFEMHSAIVESLLIEPMSQFLETYVPLSAYTIVSVNLSNTYYNVLAIGLSNCTIADSFRLAE